MNVIEPCCFTKQLRAILGDAPDYSTSETIPCFHSGDVTAEMLLGYFLGRVSGDTPVSVGVCLPCVEDSTVERLSEMLEQTYFDGTSTVSTVGQVSVVTRDPSEALLKLASADSRVSVARVTNLCTQLITLTNSNGRALSASGAMTQHVTPGWHLVTIAQSVPQHDLMRPLIDTLMRTHRVTNEE